MIAFNSTSNNFVDNLKALNDKLYSNFTKMDKLETNSTSYKELYEENEGIVKELETIIARRN